MGTFCQNPFTCQQIYLLVFKRARDECECENYMQNWTTHLKMKEIRPVHKL